MRLGKEPTQRRDVVLARLFRRTEVGDPELELRFAHIGLSHAVLVLVHKPQIEVLIVKRIGIRMLMHEEEVHGHRADEDDTADATLIVQALDGCPHFPRSLPIAGHDLQLHGEALLHVGHVDAKRLSERLQRRLAQQDRHTIRLGGEQCRGDE